MHNEVVGGVEGYKIPLILGMSSVDEDKKRRRIHNRHIRSRVNMLDQPFWKWITSHTADLNWWSSRELVSPLISATKEGYFLTKKSSIKISNDQQRFKLRKCVFFIRRIRRTGGCSLVTIDHTTGMGGIPRTLRDANVSKNASLLTRKGNIRRRDVRQLKVKTVVFDLWMRGVPCIRHNIARLCSNMFQNIFKRQILWNSCLINLCNLSIICCINK